MGLLDDLKKKAAGLVSRTWDQANPLDNGRTWQNPQGYAAPRVQAGPAPPPPNRSIAGQLTHNGVTNTLGNFVAKPFFINPTQNVIETGRMAAADLTGNVGAQQASQAREWQNLRQSLPGAIVSNGYNIGKANTYDLGRQVAADLSNNQVAKRNASDAYARDINQSAVGGLINPVTRKAAAYQVHRDMPGLNKKQQEEAVKQNVANAGLDPNANLADQLKTSAFSAVQLAAPTFGLAKAAVEGTPFVNGLQPSYLTGATFVDMAKNGGAKAQAGVEAYKNNTVPLNEVGAVGKNVNQPTPQTDPAAFAQDYFKNNHAKAQADYNAATMQEFGVNKPNIVSGDSAKFVVPDFGPNKSVPYHEAASAFAKEHYSNLLADPATKDQPVMIMAGGAGAGKTSALSNLITNENHPPLNDYAAVVDTNLTTMHAATSRIDAALKTGRDVEINYVYRDPVESFVNGVVPRASRTGRIVTDGIAAGTHAGSLDTVKQVAEKYKDNPNVHINVIDNSRGAGNSTLVPLDFLKDKSYSKDEIRSNVSAALDKAVAEGKLTQEQANGFKDQTIQAQSPTSQDNGPALSGQPQQELGQQLAPQGKLSRFANKTVQRSDEVSPGLKKLVKEEKVTYDTITRKGTLDAASKWADERTPESMYTNAVQDLASGHANSQQLANAIEAAKRLDATGNQDHGYMATELYSEISRNLSTHGQEVYIGSLLNNRTPQGLQYSAEKTLRGAGVEITPEIKQNIKAHIEKIKKSEAGSDLHDRSVKELQQYVAKQIPASTLDKMISTWKAGLLTGMKTITGNAVSNASFRLGHELSKPLAVALDKGIAAFRKDGARSQSLTYRGLTSGAGEGFTKGWEYFKTGIDERAGVGNKFLENGGREINFKNKVLNTYVNGVFRNMAAQDRPFYYSQLRTSLHELANVEGLNKGLKGKELQAYVDSALKEPSIDLMQKAKNEADIAVLANDTSLSKVIGGARQAVNKLDDGAGKTILKTAIETTMPFTGVPSAFVSRVIDFTPVGAFKEAADQLLIKKSFDQRALTTAISEATTGTAILWLGSQLAKNNLLSGPYPNNPKEQARWKAEGITPNSIKIGNKWVSLNYLGPAGMLFNAGGRMYETEKNGGGVTKRIASAAGGAPKDLTQQSFLQGLSNAVGAVNDPGRYLNNYINSQAGSIVPTLTNDVATALDKFQRDRNNPLQSIQSRIPGLRTGVGPVKGLPISNDVYGNQLKATSNPLDRMFNPLRPSNERSNPMLDEVNRLHYAGQDVTPSPIKQNIKIDGVQTNLSDAQRKQLQINVGQNVQKLWNQAMTSPEYQNLTEEGKKKQLDDIYTTVYQGEVRKYAAQNAMGQYAPNFDGKASNLSKNATDYLNGTLDISKFAKEPGATTYKKTIVKTPTKKKLASTKKSSGGRKSSNSLSAYIKTTNTINSKVASFKRPKSTFKSRIGSGRSIQAYKKPTATKVAVRSRA